LRARGLTNILEAVHSESHEILAISDPDPRAGRSWFSFLAQRTTPAERPNLLIQIQQLNQLTTVRYTVQRIVTLTEEKSLVGSESIVLIVQARVEAGVDLSSLKANDVVMGKDGSVRVRLHPRKSSTSRSMKTDQGLGSTEDLVDAVVPYSLDLEKRARILGLDSAKESAIEMGILSASQKNAETSIRSLLGLAGVKTLTVTPALKSALPHGQGRFCEILFQVSDCRAVSPGDGIDRVLSSRQYIAVRRCPVGGSPVRSLQKVGYEDAVRSIRKLLEDRPAGHLTGNRLWQPDV